MIRVSTGLFQTKYSTLEPENTKGKNNGNWIILMIGMRENNPNEKSVNLGC